MNCLNSCSGERVHLRDTASAINSKSRMTGKQLTTARYLDYACELDDNQTAGANKAQHLFESAPRWFTIQE